MGNSQRNQYRNHEGKQNISPSAKPKTSQKLGKLSICSKQNKNGKKIYFILFQHQTDQNQLNSKMIKWNHGQFEINDLNDNQIAYLVKQKEIGEFTEQQIIESIQWSSTGTFSNKKTTHSNEWCECVCWKLGKKVTLT